MTKPCDTSSIVSYTISAVDHALWDAKGRLLDQAVYSLICGPIKEKLYCYAAGKKVILHGGNRNVFGQHFSHAIPALPWLEYFFASAPGVPLAEAVDIPGQAVAYDGWPVPNDGAGFGHEIPESWLEPFF